MKTNKIIMWECICGKIGKPEDQGVVSPGKEKVGPYGWLQVTGGFIGCGPYFKDIVACSSKCLVKTLENLDED